MCACALSTVHTCVKVRCIQVCVRKHVHEWVNECARLCMRTYVCVCVCVRALALACLRGVSPAAEVGLIRVGDELLAVDGESIKGKLF